MKLEEIVALSVKHNVSDLHLCNSAAPRWRRQGKLEPAPFPAPDIPDLLNCWLDAAQLQHWQEQGQIDFALTLACGSRLRASAFAHTRGISLVLRLLPEQCPRLETLGAPPALSELLAEESGLLLVTGATGSGKSTTIYAVLHQLSTPNVNVVTIEDPVEKLVDGISQVQINPKAGLTFASGLRSILRQDPDVIMIGEIRDVETARIAARAAITGHRVLTTIHTNDAASTFMRLVDMGVEPYIVASAVVGVISQRLVRLVCPHCKREYEPDEKELSLWEGPRPKAFYRGSGCAHCNFTGYFGRTAIHEVVPMRHELSQLVVQRASVQEFRESIRASGGRFLKDNLADLVREGKTTLAEYLRVTYNIE